MKRYAIIWHEKKKKKIQFIKIIEVILNYIKTEIHLQKVLLSLLFPLAQLCKNSTWDLHG